MVPRCPGCGHLFERRAADGFFLGAYMINLGVVMAAIGVVLLADIVVQANGGSVSIALGVAVGLFIAIVVPAVYYPFSKTLWSAIDLAMNPPDIVERADAAAHHSEASEGQHRQAS